MNRISIGLVSPSPIRRKRSGGGSNTATEGTPSIGGAARTATAGFVARKRSAKATAVELIKEELIKE